MPVHPLRNMPAATLDFCSLSITIFLFSKHVMTSAQQSLATQPKILMCWPGLEPAPPDCQSGVLTTTPQCPCCRLCCNNCLCTRDGYSGVLHHNTRVLTNMRSQGSLLHPGTVIVGLNLSLHFTGRSNVLDPPNYNAWPDPHGLYNPTQFCLRFPKIYNAW